MSVRWTNEGRKAAAEDTRKVILERLRSGVLSFVNEKGEHMADVTMLSDGSFSSGPLVKPYWQSLWLAVDGDPFVEATFPQPARNGEIPITLTLGSIEVTF